MKGIIFALSLSESECIDEREIDRKWEEEREGDCGQEQTGEGVTEGIFAGLSSFRLEDSSSLILKSEEQTRFCNCGTHVCTNLISRRTKVLANGPCKARDKVNVYRETQTSNMLGTVGVELTNFVNPKLSWKTVTKGFRTSRKGSRIWANSVLRDAKSPQRDWSSDSESEKHCVAVLGRRFADQVQYVPLKKKRLLHHSSSQPARNQSPSLKSKHNKTQHGIVASGQCCSPDLECLPRALTLDDSMVSVYGPKDVDKCLKDGKPPKSMCRKMHFDFSGIDLLAATACSSMINDIGHVKDESMTDQSSTAKITDVVASMQLLKESVPSVDTADEPPEQQCLDNQDIPSAELQRANVYASEVINQSASMKYDRLHWDLNTVMEAWEPPFVDSVLNLQNDALSGPSGGSHIERLQKEGSGLCGDPEHSLVPLGQNPVDNSGPSAEIFKVRSITSVVQTREETSLHNGESQIKHGIYSGKVISDEDVSHEEDFKESYHFPDILITEETCQMINGEHSVNQIDIMNSSCKLFDQEGNLCLLSTTGGEMQLGQFSNVNLQSNKSYDESTMSSVVSNVVNGCMVVNEKLSEAQTGYESPYEDGELREGNEVECEIDSLDYGEVEHSSCNFCPPESSSPECQNMRKRNSPENVVQDGIGEDMLRLTQSARSNTKQSGRNLLLPEGCEASSGRSAVTNAVSSISRRNFVNNSIDELLDGKGVFSAAESVPKVSGGKRLFSHMERPSRSDVIHWKDAVYAKQTGSSILNESSAAALEQREVGSDKFLRRVNSSLQQQERDQKDDDCVGSSSASYWDSRNNKHYRGAYGGPPRTRLPGNRDGHYVVEQRRTFSIRDDTNREGHYIEQRKTFSIRDDTTRSRSRNRGFTKISTINDFPSAIAPNDREHAISPVHVRGADFSIPPRKSRSRSRTRSPPVWNFRRERYKQLPNDEDKFLPSGRFSSKYHSKWNDDSDRISSRSSLGRMFKRNWADSTKFDEQFHPGRGNNDRIGSRGSKCDDDKRKQHSDKYEMIRRVRENDTSDIRRFRYDARTIKDKNRYIKSIDRNNREEERGESFGSRRVRTYTSGPKFSAIRDYDDDVSPKKR